MKKQSLHLPPPADEPFETVYGALYDFLRPITPGNVVGRLGGGTALAAQWGHRRSTDIDITVPEGTGLNIYEPGRNEDLIGRMEQLGAVRVSVRYRTLIFQFPHGKLDIVEQEMPIRLGQRPVDVDGKQMLVHSNGQILSGKLVGRGNMNVARDVFDIAVALRQDPDALQAAINHLEAGYREDVAYRIAAYGERFRKEAMEGILDVAPQWRPLLSTAPETAAQAIADLAYSAIDLDYGGAGVALRLRSLGDDKANEYRYATGQALVDALPELGLEPYFMAFHGRPERMVEAVNREIDRAQGRGALE